MWITPYQSKRRILWSCFHGNLEQAFLNNDEQRERTVRSEPQDDLAALLAKSTTDKTKIKALRAELKSVSAKLTLK